MNFLWLAHEVGSSLSLILQQMKLQTLTCAREGRFHSIFQRVFWQPS